MQIPIERAERLVPPGSFERESHFYPRVLSAQVHPLVRYFMDLGNDRIASRYCHLHPEVQPDAVRALLETSTRWFRWAGADLFHAADQEGRRHILVIETNSSPSGQKSMPLLHEQEEQAGYRRLMERCFLPLLRRRSLPSGELAVLLDKNPVEATGYASVLADLTGEHVHLVPAFVDDPEPQHRFVDGLLEVRSGGAWTPIRAAMRYVTQRPWTRIPPITRTAILNPVITCLAGGRNKLLAAKAYDLLNAELAPTGLQIRVPETIWDVTHDEVPLWVARMGGVAVVKNPYSNAGQGVYTITSQEELDAFADSEQRYDRFIVQALVGNTSWSSRTRQGRLYHVGTVPNRKGHIYAADLRVMVGAGPDGFFPVAIYGRRARRPLEAEPPKRGEGTSWDVLGTNLSVRRPDGSWDTEPQRLLLMDSRDFNHLGLGLDDLVEAYLQTILSVVAIDRMADRLVTQKGRFRRRFFGELNPDPSLLQEILEA